MHCNCLVFQMHKMISDMQHRQERAKQQSCSSTWCQLIHLCTGCQQTRYWLCMTIVSSHMQRGNSTQSWPVHRCTTSNQPLNVGVIASSSCRMERTTHTLRTYPVIEGLSLAPTEQAKVRGGLALKASGHDLFSYLLLASLVNVKASYESSFFHMHG